MTKKLKIGICLSETNYANYPTWILGNQDAIEIVELACEKQNEAELKVCDGLLLTGGIDIDPFYFDKNLMSYPNQPNSWNRARDEFEITLFNTALKLSMPVLGICRGLQLINVALGGNLITDIEFAGYPNHRSKDGIDYVHQVKLEPNSLLAKISEISSGEINSAHHQAIDTLGEALKVNCNSEEGIIEGIEWENAENKSPLLAVQWHPERIKNKEINPLSKKIRDWFLKEAAHYKN